MIPKEEAAERGIPIKHTNHNKKRRSLHHDYTKPGIYMVTIVVDGRKPLLGKLISAPSPYIELSPLGKAILEDEFAKITAVYPNVLVYKTCIMPDHIHIVICVTDKMQPNKHLGNVIYGFKTGCNKVFHHLGGTPGMGLFERKYNDRILFSTEQIYRWYHYLDDNPRRLAMKRLHPDLFTVMTAVQLCGIDCSMIGNRFLLDIPDKAAVIVHHSDTDEDFERLRNRWLAFGEGGGVLVSAGVAPREKEVMREAFIRGYNIIQLKENGFPPLYKPQGRIFDACSDGRLLQISPWAYHTEQRKITRQQCLFLNDFAEEICRRL